MLDSKQFETKVSKAKPVVPKLPKVKRPPDSVLKAVVKRAAAKSALAKLPYKGGEGKPALKKKGRWALRETSAYIQALREICGRHLQDGGSVLDVGSNRTPTLEWHRTRAKHLVSLDLHKPYRGRDVEVFLGDIFDFRPVRPFDLVTCFHVLERIPDAHAFAQKLLTTGKIVIVSVPYTWARVKSKHLHDPVDELKMMGWFGQSPLETLVIDDGKLRGTRLIQVYRGEEEKAGKWSDKLVGKIGRLRPAR